MGHSAQENTVAAHIHRSELDVRFHEKALGVAVQLHDIAEILGISGRHACAQCQKVAADFHISLQNVVLDRHQHTLG